MARPRKDKIMQAVSLRLPDALIDRVDACADRLQSETPLLEVTRTDALRYLIQIGLAEFEKPKRRPRESSRP
jgi:predicted transcriptional regulator